MFTSKPIHIYNNSRMTDYTIILNEAELLAVLAECGESDELTVGCDPSVAERRDSIYEVPAYIVLLWLINRGYLPYGTTVEFAAE